MKSAIVILPFFLLYAFLDLNKIFLVYLRLIALEDNDFWEDIKLEPPSYFNEKLSFF